MGMMTFSSHFITFGVAFETQAQAMDGDAFTILLRR